MRFNCGMTAAQKRAIKAKKKSKARQYRLNWHAWFAWYPVQIDEGDCRWLEWIERKLKYDDSLSDEFGMRVWEYRAIPYGYELR